MHPSRLLVAIGLAAAFVPLPVRTRAQDTLHVMLDFRRVDGRNARTVERLILQDSTYAYYRDASDTTAIRGRWHARGDRGRIILFNARGGVYRRCTYRLRSIARLREGPCVRSYELRWRSITRRRMKAFAP